MSITIAIIIFSIMVSCSNKTDIPKIQNVGMLLEGSISDHAWNQIGYNGLQAVSNQFNVDVLYKEGIETKNEIIDAVDEFVQNGVNLIFGHSNIYGRYFGQIAEEYPKVQFVYFNGNYFDENVVSLNFNSHAMGFYGGMIAAKMSQSKQVGVIAAYEWQQEIRSEERRVGSAALGGGRLGQLTVERK